ncbi:hypothetical protein ACNJYA_08030 [Bradyrhizobium sp. DASA03068]|uniref:hypothetical protein n=1 Tax=Bradyrhizobium sp. BLXBL-01 TaxID=3395915 RepID=UPI003F72A2D1
MSSELAKEHASGLTMDRFNTINPADREPTASDASVEQPQQPHVAFEQHLAGAREAGPVYPHAALYDVTEEDDRLIQAASAAALDRVPPLSKITVEIYDRRLRNLADALKKSGKSISGLDDDTLADHAKKLLRGDKIIAPALSIVSQYREPDADAGPISTHYRPSREDERLIRKAANAGFGRRIGKSTAGTYASHLRKLAVALRPLSIAELSDDRLLGHADRLFPKNKTLIVALNGLRDYRATTLQNDLGGEGGSSPHFIQPSAPSPTPPADGRPMGSVADGGGSLPPGFDVPQVMHAMGLAAYSPIQSVAQDELFDAADREGLLLATTHLPVPWPTMVQSPPSPVQSVAQEELFDAADRENLLPPRTFDAPVPWPTMSPAAQTTLEQRFAAAGDVVNAALSVPGDFSHGTQGAPNMIHTLRRWGLLPDAAQRVKTYDIRGERYIAVLGPGGLNDVQLVHLRSPPVGDTFDVSFVVPENFSHRTQLAPDMMLSTLGDWDFLPVAEHPIMNYQIGGERYTAILGPEGPKDVQLIHHPRPALPGEATPAARRTSSDIYGGLAPGFDSPAPFEWREDPPSAPAPNLPLPSAAPASAQQPFPQVPELGELLGDGWTHGPQEASPAMIDILQILGLLPSRGVPMTVFSIHGQRYTAESLAGGGVLLFHRP